MLRETEPALPQTSPKSRTPTLSTDLSWCTSSVEPWGPRVHGEWQAVCPDHTYSLLYSVFCFYPASSSFATCHQGQLVSKSSLFLPLLFPFVCHRHVSAPAVRDADCPSRPEPGTEQVLRQREEMQCELWAVVLSSVTDPSNPYPSSNPSLSPPPPLVVVCCFLPGL